MITPDIIITACNLILLPPLIPMILSPVSQKPPLLSSVPTFIGLYIMGLTFFSISLTFTTIMTLLTGTAWLVLAIQRIKFLRTLSEKK